MRRKLANAIRSWADRIDPNGAARATGWSFTFEPGRGIVFNEAGRGCRLWYLGEQSYQRAHDEAVGTHLFRMSAAAAGTCRHRMREDGITKICGRPEGDPIHG